MEQFPQFCSHKEKKMLQKLQNKQFLEALKIIHKKHPLTVSNSIKFNTDLGYQKHIKN